MYIGKSGESKSKMDGDGMDMVVHKSSDDDETRRTDGGQTEQMLKR